jgi:PPP family 3-phenylpropionic acid transporter
MKSIFKLFYFIYFICVGIYGPYLPLYLAEKGLSGIQISTILLSLPIAGLITSPIWSYLSDLLNKRKLLVVIGCLGAGISAIALGRADQYVAIFIWTITMIIMGVPISPIGTAIVLETLEGDGGREEFGLVRLWGSVGFATASLVWGSFFLDQISLYFSWSVAVVFFVVAGTSLLLPKKSGELNRSGVGGVKTLIKNKHFTIYLLGSIFIGASLSAHNSFQTFFFQSLDASSFLIGLIISMQAILEIPFMMSMPALFKRFSMRVMILAGAVALILRWVIYLFIQQAVWLVPTQILNGLGTPAFSVVGAAYVDKIVNPKWRATAQGFYNAFWLGIGSSIGVYFAGTVYDGFGVRAIWVLNLILGLIGLAILVFAFGGFKLGKKKEAIHSD